MAEKKKKLCLPETKDKGDQQLDNETSDKSDQQLDKEVNESKDMNNDSGLGEEEELSKLLDSALEDFLLSECDLKKPEDMERGDPPNNSWEKEFLNRRNQRTREPIPSTSSAADPLFTNEELETNMQDLAGASAHGSGGAEASYNPELENQSAQASGSGYLTAAQRYAHNEELRKVMASLNASLESPELNEVFPFILSLMHNLLSKEVLYGDLKGIVEKYKPWLLRNRGRVPQEEYDLHVKKLIILQEVCSELERESSDDSDDIKKVRSERVLMLMLKIQDLGPMPPEVTGDIDPVLGFRGQGTSNLPFAFNPNQCNSI